PPPPPRFPSAPTRRSSDLERARSRDLRAVVAQLGIASRRVPSERRRHTVRHGARGRDSLVARGVEEMQPPDEHVGESECHLPLQDRKSTRLNSSHGSISYA